MPERPWAEPGARTSRLFAVLFWAGALLAALVLLQSELPPRDVVYLAGGGTACLAGALLLTVRLRRLRRETREGNENA